MLKKVINIGENSHHHYRLLWKKIFTQSLQQKCPGQLQSIYVWAISPANCSIYLQRLITVKNPGGYWKKLRTNLAFSLALTFLFVLKSAWPSLTRKSLIHLLCRHERECRFFSIRNDTCVRPALMHKSGDFYPTSIV